MCCLCKSQQWPPLLHSDAALGLSHFFVPWLNSLLGCGSPHSSGELQVEVSRAGTFSQLRLSLLLLWSWETGSHWGSPPSALFALSQEHVSTHVLLTAESMLPVALLLVPTAAQPAKWACLLCVGPKDWGTQHVAWIARSPGGLHPCFSLFLRVLPQGHRSWPDCFFSLPTWFCLDLSYSLECTWVFPPVSN